MAWGEFTFSREGRMRLVSVLQALLIVQLVLSLCMAIFCYNTCLKVLVLLKHIHKVTVYLLYILILLQTYCLKLHYTSGLRLMSSLVRAPYRPRAMYSSLIWLVSGTCVALNGILVYVAVKATLAEVLEILLLQTNCLKLHYTSGLRLMSSLVRAAYRARAMYSSFIWLVSGTCVAVNGILVYVAVKATLAALVKELNSSLRLGISVYLVEPRWKIILDTIQIELGCCGADKPQDWHEIPWINVHFLNEHSGVVMKLAGADGKALPPVSPFSCCTPRILAACYHDPFQQWDYLEAWPEGSPLVTASLHARGCIEAVRTPLTKAVLALQLLSYLVVIIQVVIVLVSQLIRSSARDALLRGDCDGDGRATLLGRPKPLDAHQLMIINSTDFIEGNFEDIHEDGDVEFGSQLTLNRCEQRRRARRRRPRRRRQHARLPY